LKAFFVNMPDPGPSPFNHHVLCAMALDLPLAWAAKVEGHTLKVIEPTAGRAAQLVIVTYDEGAPFTTEQIQAMMPGPGRE
jgi:hypothetical protein